MTKTLPKKTPPRIVTETGKIELTWEHLSAPSMTGWKCFACQGSIDLGEFVASLKINVTYYKFHLSCMEQFVTILSVFLEASDGMTLEEKVN